VDEPGETRIEEVTVGVFPSEAEAHEHALVILAMGSECEVRFMETSFVLLAPATRADAIRAEFVAYAEEQRELKRLPPPPEPRRYPNGASLLPLWIVGLLWVHHLQAQDPTLRDRFCNSVTGVFDDGEWWRPFTALFLHVNLEHLFGNILSGSIFFALVTTSLGARTGWALIFASGTMGNLLAAWLHRPDPYTSVGASTAIFGALGILTGFSTRQAWTSRGGAPRPMRLLTPAIAGLILLGELGSGEPPTDLLSHAMGFAAGVILGLLAPVAEPS
jgi:membrane associated rhomboid family serine protease